MIKLLLRAHHHNNNNSGILLCSGLRLPSRLYLSLLRSEVSRLENVKDLVWAWAKPCALSHEYTCTASNMKVTVINSFH